MKRFFYLLLIALVPALGYGQNFEEDKIDGSEFEKVKVGIGADFAVQFQALDHSADSTLIPLGHNINLPTANFTIKAELAPGIRVNLTTYLSSRHHPEAWVKDGYLLIDQLPFLNSAFLDKVMSVTTLKFGVMELNYGDAHFRRSDNGRVISNPFVGNYIMDAFTTAPAAEIMVRHEGLIAMAGITTGSLKPALTGYSGFSGTYTPYNMGEELGFYGKLGYDKQINEDLRLRGTVSGYYVGNHHFGSLYYGDRTGSRYYLIMNQATGSSDDVNIAKNHLSGRWSPGFTDRNAAVMFNLFAEFHGLEVFGTLEHTSGTGAFSGAEFAFTQYAIDALYRFGKEEQFYAGGRYNGVSNDQDQSVSRVQAGAGWFITPNILFKAEYVNQVYDQFVQYGDNAKFNGLMVEAAISF